MIVVLDFETRSEVNLRACGQDVYAAHPSTSILCMGYAVDQGPVRVLTQDDFLYAPDCPVPAHAQFVAHNASFERSIWREICHKRLGWPDIPLEQWHCTAARSSQLALPRKLEDLARVLGCQEKDMTGHRVMLKYCKPRKPTKNNKEVWHRDTAELELIYEYCRLDVAAEREILALIKDLPAAEREVWLLNERVNDRGLAVDSHLAQCALRMEQAYSERLRQRLEQLTGGEVSSGRQTQRLLAWLIERGVNVDSVDRLSLLAAVKKVTSPEVREAIECRLQLARSATDKLAAMLVRSCDDDRLRGAHIYCGSHTGRFSGSGLQPQNLSRGVLSDGDIPFAIRAVEEGDIELLTMLYDSPKDVLSSLVRSCIAAAPGHRLLVCDFAGIEARVLATLAGCHSAVTSFREGKDIYKEMASKIFKIPVDQVSKDQRFLGKTAVLGLGYGMGVQRFMETCKAQGGEVSEELAELAVTTYRKEAFPQVRRLWWNLNQAALEVIKNPAARVRVNGLLVERDSVGRIDMLTIRLLSGRKLYYAHPEVVEIEKKWGMVEQMTYWGVDSTSRKWACHETFGGKLVENVVSAISRDFLVCAMMRLEQAGYRTVLHVHDEIVCEMAYGEGSIDEMERLMCELPSWGKQYPIATEGFETERYRK